MEVGVEVFMWNRGFDFDHVNAEMPVSYPGGAFTWAARYMNLYYREEGPGCFGVYITGCELPGEESKGREEKRFRTEPLSKPTLFRGQSEEHLQRRPGSKEENQG